MPPVKRNGGPGIYSVSLPRGPLDDDMEPDVFDLFHSETPFIGDFDDPNPEVEDTEEMYNE